MNSIPDNKKKKVLKLNFGNKDNVNIDVEKLARKKINSLQSNHSATVNHDYNSYKKKDTNEKHSFDKEHVKRLDETSKKEDSNDSEDNIYDSDFFARFRDLNKKTLDEQNNTGKFIKKQSINLPENSPQSKQDHVIDDDVESNFQAADNQSSSMSSVANNSSIEQVVIKEEVHDSEKVASTARAKSSSTSMGITISDERRNLAERQIRRFNLNSKQRNGSFFNRERNNNFHNKNESKVKKDYTKTNNNNNSQYTDYSKLLEQNKNQKKDINDLDTLYSQRINSVRVDNSANSNKISFFGGEDKKHNKFQHNRRNNNEKPKEETVVEIHTSVNNNVNKKVDKKVDKKAPAKFAAKSKSKVETIHDIYHRAREKSFESEKDSIGESKKIASDLAVANKNWKLTLNQGQNDEEHQRVRALLQQKKKKNIKSRNKKLAPKIKKVIEIENNTSLTVNNLAKLMGEKAKFIEKTIKDNQIPMDKKNVLGINSIEFLVEILGHKFKLIEKKTLEDSFADSVKSIKKEFSDDVEDFELKVPVVTIMGHVDHGKTSLLDFFRNSRVTDGEMGGITQHIGAYQVNTKNGAKITFLDTPGHEAFSKIRSQGANSTDIVILVVAADDGVKPQTIEAINHAKAAKVPIIVAINKIDKPDIDIEKVKNQLSQHEIISSEWGGDYSFVNISAKTGQNIDLLEEEIILQAEANELMAMPHGKAAGIVLETKMHPKKGYCASLLVQKGMLNKGDVLVAGESWCTVRTIVNDVGRSIDHADVCQPVEVFGFNSLPESGQYFAVMNDLHDARELVEERINKKKQVSNANTNNSKLVVDFFAEEEQNKPQKELSIIIKADTQGSVDAIKYSIDKLESADMKIKVIAANVGNVTSSDIDLAKITDSMIIVFNGKSESNIANEAKINNIEIKNYSIIYQIIDDMQALINDTLGPKIEEKTIGQAMIKQVFGKTKYGQIIGCNVKQGIVKQAIIRVVRDKKMIHESSLRSLEISRKTMEEVQAGFDCGMIIDGFFEGKIGDKIEVVQRDIIKN